MQAHNIERATYDLDILISRDGANPEKLLPLVANRSAIVSPKLSVEMLRLPQKLICLPDLENKEVDVLTSIGALNFELALSTSIAVSFGDLMLSVLGLEELIYSKAISASRNEAPEAKMRDLDDMQMLLAHWQARHNPSF